MERITLYHEGAPVTHYSLENRSFSIGTHPENDLVLASDGVRERHLVIQKSDDGRWLAKQVGDGLPEGCASLEEGRPIALGSFAVALDAPPEKIEAIVDVGDQGLLLRQAQAHRGEDPGDLLAQCLRVGLGARHDQAPVVRLCGPCCYAEVAAGSRYGDSARP